MTLCSSARRVSLISVNHNRPFLGLNNFTISQIQVITRSQNIANMIRLILCFEIGEIVFRYILEIGLFFKRFDVMTRLKG